MGCGNQLFKSVPDYKIVFDFLDKFCSKEDKIFVIDDIVFKKMKYDDNLFSLQQYLKSFYHLSKQKYINLMTTNNGFLTVMRQLCKVFCIEYVSKITYYNGSYSKTLLIYLERNNWSSLPEPSCCAIG